MCVKNKGPLKALYHENYEQYQETEIPLNTFGLMGLINKS